MASAMGMFGKGRDFLKEIDEKLPPEDAKKLKNLLLAGAVRQVVERPNGDYHMPTEGNGAKKKGGGGELIPAVFPWDPKLKVAGPGSRRTKLADFVTGSRRFAEVQVNRLWAQLFGHGIVNPVDDFKDDNPPSNPELLKYLADEFVQSKFDNKHVLSLILNSSAYQRSSQPQLASNKDDVTLFSHQRVRRMTAEELFDSILIATGRLAGMDAGSPLTDQNAFGDKFKRALFRDKPAQPIEWAEDLGTPAKAGSFMDTFCHPAREQMAMTRDEAGSVAQALEMPSGSVLNNAIRDSPRINFETMSHKDGGQLL